MLRKTIIRKVKRPDGVGRWPAYVVSEDSFGVWLYSPKGTIYRGRTGSIITECEVGQGHRAAGRPVLHLIPRAAWWMAAWCFDGDEPVIGADICTPPSLIEGEWRYVDLELDPHVFGDGRVEVLDEDEFRAACDAGVIVPTEAVEARKAAQELARHLRDRVEPFGAIGWGRFHDALALTLPPITVLRGEATA
jgi:protein associated with RNAse G/E